MFVCVEDGKVFKSGLNKDPVEEVEGGGEEKRRGPDKSPVTQIYSQVCLSCH